MRGGAEAKIDIEAARPAVLQATAVYGGSREPGSNGESSKPERRHASSSRPSRDGVRASDATGGRAQITRARRVAARVCAAVHGTAHNVQRTQPDRLLRNRGRSVVR